MTDLACTNQQLEERLIATVMRDPRSLRRMPRLSSTDFAFAQCESLWSVIMALSAAGRPINGITVRKELEARGVRGADRIVSTVASRSLLSSVVSAAEEVLELAQRRYMRERCLRAAHLCESGTMDDVREVAASALKPAMATMPVRFETAEESVRAAWDSLGKSETADRLKIGIPAFDKAIGPLWPGSLTVVGGHQGSGKSSLMLKMAMEMAKRRRVGFVSCEDGRETNGMRIMSALTNPPTDASEAFRGQLDYIMSGHLKRGVERSATVNMRFAYAINRPAPDVLFAMRKLVQDDRCDVVFVDYLQAIRIELARGIRIDKAYADVVKLLKGGADQLRVPLVLGSQCKRLDAGRGGKGYKEPRPADLKETGDLENEAEVILMCWVHKPREPARCRLAKLKWGPGGHLWELIRSEAGVIECIEKPSIAKPDAKDFQDGPRTPIDRLDQLNLGDGGGGE